MKKALISFFVVISIIALSACGNYSNEDTTKNNRSSGVDMYNTNLIPITPREMTTTPETTAAPETVSNRQIQTAEEISGYLGLYARKTYSKLLKSYQFDLNGKRLFLGYPKDKTVTFQYYRDSGNSDMGFIYGEISVNQFYLSPNGELVAEFDAESRGYDYDSYDIDPEASKTFDYYHIKLLFQKDNDGNYIVNYNIRLLEVGMFHSKYLLEGDDKLYLY